MENKESTVKYEPKPKRLNQSEQLQKEGYMNGFLT